ncbi:MAG: adenylate/guanylate cyclase domain-containing protein [Candidatus Eremiobacteraeota bacterium]|nr:adenylate/guanylate cyclase domain-containing protein [Candidatus Eremiobacteraeota bacterium]MBV8371892.1 adenylate/guanylate cyclase domain-containing protein [Candidatus Eremiobacteraeota bacterium]
MPGRLRALVIALLLGAVASGIGTALVMLPLVKLPVANRIADLAVHVNALDAAHRLGLGRPVYDAIPNPRLGIVAIDDITYQKMGFPLPRSFYATLLDKLRAAGAKTVVFDIDFLQPSKDRSQDDAFATALQRMPSVLAFPLNTTTAGHIGEERPLPSLAHAAKALGYEAVDLPGGYLIGQPMEIDTAGNGVHANERLFALAAAAVATFTGKPVDTISIPKDDDGRMLLLPPKTTAHQDLATAYEVLTQAFAGRGIISFSDAVASKPVDLQTFARDALVFVGATAVDVGDFAITAGRGRVPGLFVNARLSDQLMRGFFLTAAPPWLNVALIVVLPLLIALGFTFMRTPIAIVVSLAAAVAYGYVNLWLFVTRLYWLDLVHVVLAMILSAMLVAAYRLVTEGTQRRMVTNLFGMHVSPAIVAEILKQDDPRGTLALHGKRVKATIFYSDIRGFTAMSEGMSPEEIYTQLNEYFEEMCKIVFAYGGYVDKFIGDCLMAVFSAPYQTPDDARNAVISALKQQEKTRELCERWKAAGKKEFTVGMGVNTGEVVMGNLGASSRMNYTVIGDNVNVAARLYNVAKGGEIIISETTYAECKDVVDAEPLEPVHVKGKNQPIAIYNVTAFKEATRTELITA